MLIYKITNLINNKIYIGQTVKTLEQRWKQHICQTRYVGGNSNRKICRYLHTSIAKHGSDNFKIEVIDWATNETELNYKEWLWIHKLNSLSPNGYNLRIGGNKKTISESTRKLLSSRLSGKNNPMYGEKGSENQKKWLKKYNSERVITEEMIENMKKIQQERAKLGLNKGFTRKKTGEEIEKTVKKLRKKYTLISPEGLIYRVSDIRSFSREYNLSNRQLRRIAQYKKGKHKGWQSFSGF